MCCSRQDVAHRRCGRRRIYCIRKLLTHCREIWELIWRCLVFDAESIKGREQSSKELLRNAFDALICTSEKLDFQKKSYELFGFNIGLFISALKSLYWTQFCNFLTNNCANYLYAMLLIFCFNLSINTVHLI